LCCPEGVLFLRTKYLPERRITMWEYVQAKEEYEQRLKDAEKAYRDSRFRRTNRSSSFLASFLALLHRL
jgi:hypothetical protein